MGPFVTLAAGGVFCAAFNLHWGWFTVFAVCWAVDLAIDMWEPTDPDKGVPA